MAAAAAYLFLLRGVIGEHSVVQGAALAVAVQTRMVALAKAVEIGLSCLALQAADRHKIFDGDVSVVGAAAQGVVHGLWVVHLAVAHTALLAAETAGAAVGIGDELLRGNELYAAIHHVAPCHLRRVGMLAKKFQLGRQRAERRLHTTAITQPHRCHIAEQVEEKLYLALAGMAVFGTEVVYVVKGVLTLNDGRGIEQGSAVVTFCGSRLQFEKYSVCLTWHSVLFLQFAPT